MQIHGFNKTTLLDYPGLVAATVFTGACNFRCPFCQNADLVLNPSSQPLIATTEILDHLRKRKGITKGVCITGGEPTLQPDLKDFLDSLKTLDLKVKLDTNGYNPAVLKDLCESGLIDYVAMDIKSSPERYSEASGVSVDVSRILESVSILINGKVDYEFRTTVTRELHDEQTFADIAVMLNHAGKYFLQGYQDSERVIKPGFTAYSRQQLEAFLPIFKGKIDKVSIRGVD